MPRIIMICLVSLISCYAYSQNKNKNNKSIRKSYKINIDEFLGDQNISPLAKNLYLGKIKPTPKNENLALIDSINSKSQRRDFYFLAITKSMEYADGAYAEPLGIAANTYVENNTIDFFSYFEDNKDLLSNKDFSNWAHLIYIEIQIDSEGSV